LRFDMAAIRPTKGKATKGRPSPASKGGTTVAAGCWDGRSATLVDLDRAAKLGHGK